MTDDHVTVTGTAGRAVAPGTVTWRAEAVEADDDPRAAFERCSGRLNALVERLAGLGDVATEAVVVEPRLHKRRPGAVGAVRVSCPAELAGEVAQAAMAAGADRLHGPQFEYEAHDLVREELLDEAVADARRKGRRLAAAAGRRLGPVRQMKERGSDDRVPFVEAMAVSEAGGPPDVRPREQTVTAAVTVVFALED